MKRSRRWSGAAAANLSESFAFCLRLLAECLTLPIQPCSCSDFRDEHSRSPGAGRPAHGMGFRRRYGRARSVPVWR
jgi:hypothetical protein